MKMFDWLVAAFLGAAVGIAIGSMHTKNTLEDKPPVQGDYIQTPTGKTKVFKFEDDDGSKCYIAEGARDDVALQCEITP